MFSDVDRSRVAFVWRMLNHLWVPFFLPWLPNCPIKMCLIMTRVILVMPVYFFCPFSPAIHLFEKKMNYAETQTFLGCCYAQFGCVIDTKRHYMCRSIHSIYKACIIWHNFFYPGSTRCVWSWTDVVSNLAVMERRRIADLMSSTTSEEHGYEYRTVSKNGNW